jgi:hypothetical protein
LKLAQDFYSTIDERQTDSISDFSSSSFFLWQYLASGEEKFPEIAKVT